MSMRCYCHVGRVTPAPRSYRHNEVVVLSGFAQAVLDLHDEIGWDPDRAYNAARAAVRCARMLELREEYR